MLFYILISFGPVMFKQAAFYLDRVLCAWPFISKINKCVHRTILQQSTAHSGTAGIRQAAWKHCSSFIVPWISPRGLILTSSKIHENTIIYFIASI